MLPRHHPDRIRIAFDDHRLVANAGLILPSTLARHLGLPELVQQRLDLGNAPGRANTGDKMMTLVASALAGGDCIDDADVLRTGGTARALGGTVKAPSTPRFREGRLWAPSWVRRAKSSPMVSMISDMENWGRSDSFLAAISAGSQSFPKASGARRFRSSQRAGALSGWRACWISRKSFWASTDAFIEGSSAKFMARGWVSSYCPV